MDPEVQKKVAEMLKKDPQLDLMNIDVHKLNLKVRSLVPENLQ